MWWAGLIVECDPRMEAWVTWKRQSVASVFRQIGRAPGERVSMLFSGTVDRRRHSLFFWGFPMASFSPVMVLAPASRGCWFRGGACEDLWKKQHIGLVLCYCLLTLPAKVMLPLSSFVCTQYVEIHGFFVYCFAPLPPPMHVSLVWFVRSSNNGCLWCSPVLCGFCLLITKVCRMFLQDVVTLPLPQNSYLFLKNHHFISSKEQFWHPWKFQIRLFCPSASWRTQTSFGGFDVSLIFYTLKERKKVMFTYSLPKGGRFADVYSVGWGSFSVFPI